jgi:hypothetical protein
MLDWEHFVRRRLGDRLGLRSEIVRELAHHLEDSHTNHLLRGDSAEDAVRLTLAEAGDWASLCREIEWEEATMRDRVRMLRWPGVVLFFVVYVLLRAVQLTGYEPATWATNTYYPLQIYVPWLAVLPLVGVAAALWSRRAGQRPWEWVLLSLFPSLVYAGFVLFTVVGGLLVDVLLTGNTSPEAVLLTASTFGLQFMVLPGAMLVLGALLVVLLARGSQGGDTHRAGPDDAGTTTSRDGRTSSQSLAVDISV